MSKELLTFDVLASNIETVNEYAGNKAKGAVNRLTTMRNWVIGYYIVEYEQNGEDRAEYGSHLLKSLEEKIDKKGLNVTLFQLSRLFYRRYPQIYATVSHEFSLPEDTEIYATVSHKYKTDPMLLINNLSFSQIREIMKLDDPLERSELIGRASALIRRYHTYNNSANEIKADDHPYISIGGIHITTTRNEVYRNDVAVSLTELEYQILLLIYVIRGQQVVLDYDLAKI